MNSNSNKNFSAENFHTSPYNKNNFNLISTFNEGSSLIVPIPSVSNQSFAPIPIVSADIDITCFCNPIVKVDFISIVNYEAILVRSTGTIVPRIYVPFTAVFQLTRTCNDGSKILLKSWSYSYSSLPFTSNITQNFNFMYCDKNPKPGSYVYGVELIRINYGIFNTAISDDIETFSIENSTLSLTAIDR